MQELNYKKIIEGLTKASREISVVHNSNLDDISVHLTDLCNALRVARIEVIKTINQDNRHGTFGAEHANCYVAENFDPDNYYTATGISSGFVDASYNFYQFKGDEPFTDTEKECMEFLSRFIFLLAGNILLNKHLNFAMFHEMRFKDVYNNTFLHYKLNQFLNEGKIENFGILQYNLHGFGQINKKIGEKQATMVLEMYHNGLKKIIGDDPDADGFDVALGGDNGFIVFRKDLKEELIAYLSSTEMKIMTEKGTEEYIVLYSNFGYNMELEGFDSSYMILSSASTALTIARRSPGLKFIEYDESFKKKFEMQRKIESWYTDALKGEEFLVYYQPKVELHNYSLKGAEALVRWIHKEIMIYPDQFIPVLENNLTIKYLDLYMLNHVCQDIRKWLNEGKDVPQISVNLSRATLAMTNLVDVITSTIDKYDIPRSLIQIELTESASDADNEELRPLVTGLNKEGISTAVDDFGTGFSSLSLIKELPWDVLKVDKSLLLGAQKDGSRDQLMFKSIISMAQTMGLECIVEGVETKDDVRILKESGCFMAQGYYFSKPKPKEEFEALLGDLTL
ncbi:EAL domain-containing protein [Treponema sp.]|uniref:EAL domain-containing protein n=1 Tax=Treponema sp. TaxID=166 RepID=UPI00388D9388